MRGRRNSSQPPAPHDLNQATSTGLNIIAGADQSESSLLRKLGRSGFDAETAAAAVDQLREHGYVNDVALAGSVAARRTRSGYGRGRIAADLNARGISNEVIDETLRTVDDEGELTAARAAVAKWRRSHPGPLDRAASGRLAAAMQRRGFTYSMVATVVREWSDPEDL